MNFILRKKSIPFFFLTITLTLTSMAKDSKKPLVLFTDFGTTERFVASMKGVALSVDPELNIHDLTHHIEPYNIWQASYVLAGTIEFWPKGTVFVSVIDPGVGTKRKSVVVETRTGHYIVTPDNGTLTLVADTHGIVAVREIDESINRRPGSEGMHTFHGRDVYTYTGARLAAGVIGYDGVGPDRGTEVLRLNYQKPKRIDDQTVLGNLIHVETPFDNIVTNIPTALLEEKGLSRNDNANLRIQIHQAEKLIFDQSIAYVDSFGFVKLGDPLIYSDSLDTIGLAVNNGNFSEQFGVKAGQEWSIRISQQ